MYKYKYLGPTTETYQLILITIILFHRRFFYYPWIYLRVQMKYFIKAKKGPREKSGI